MGEFGSLLQLGFGIGAGLSVFKAPINRRISRLRSKIEHEIGSVRNLGNSKASAKLGELSSINFQLSVVQSELEIFQTPFLFAAIVGALSNLSLLIYASMEAQKVISSNFQLFLIFISVFYYGIIVAILEFASMAKLDELETKFKLLCQED